MANHDAWPLLSVRLDATTAGAEKRNRTACGNHKGLFIPRLRSARQHANSAPEWD